MLQVTASDANTRDKLTYAITGGNKERMFYIGESDGKLRVSRAGVDELFGLDSFSAWIRVKGVAPELMDAKSQNRRSSVSGYFATNHWFVS